MFPVPCTFVPEYCFFLHSYSHEFFLVPALLFLKTALFPGKDVPIIVSCILVPETCVVICNAPVNDTLFPDYCFVSYINHVLSWTLLCFLHYCSYECSHHTCSWIPTVLFLALMFPWMFPAYLFLNIVLLLSLMFPWMVPACLFLHACSWILFCFLH